MQRFLLTGLLVAGLTGLGRAQETFPRNGVADERAGLYAFTNATIVVDPQTTLTGATLLIREGRVEAVGQNLGLPAGAVVTDLGGRRIYPGLIDLDADYGLPELKREPGPSGFFGAAPQYESAKKGPYYWNQAIQPEVDAGGLFKADDKRADEWRKLGFGAVLTHAHDGIARGSGALVTLAADRENALVLRSDASAHYSFSKGLSRQTAPNSIMGAVALLRQALYDADWYGRVGHREQENRSLAALNQLRSLPAVFEVSDKLGVLRADKIGDEFGIPFIIRSAGDEYQRIDEVKATGAALIVPLNFPAAYDVADAWDADNVALSELKHWEMAPANAGLLANAGVPFALTSAGLKDRTTFWANLRKAIQYGLPESAALAALTTTPARLIRAGDLLGSLQPGRVANFLITSGNLFSPDVVIYENWIRGKQHIVTNRNGVDDRGTYTLTVRPVDGSGPQALTLTVAGKSVDKPEYQLLRDTVKLNPTVTVAGDIMTLQVQLDKKPKTAGAPGAGAPAAGATTLPGAPATTLSGGATTRLTGYRTSATTWQGDGQLPDGRPVRWTAERTRNVVAAGTVPGVPATTSVKADSARKPELGRLLYPFVGMGNAEKPRATQLLIRNATVWTNEKEGILPNADVLVQGGKIARVGPNLAAPGATVIDGTGKHLTSGIIDEHSHIALLSVNEGSQSSTAEVRMADVINSEDINIYRQLAGGVTAAQLLHGSANAIGGQSALIKLKWGEAPAGLLIPNADGFIKFALGENVKQANWGDANRTRFPQTRMGVEQVFYDHFIRAREYARQWQNYQTLRAKRGTKTLVQAPRRDLELDALNEILEKKRFITCHSYVQSEINMLMHVADSLGFTVNTFTHILEGYKLADKMAKHGAGGSSFADWWAYKMEVKDAIPYNAALMARQGVLVSINSDDAEMARRLNQEAAKTVEYGGLPEEDAWKTVTLNPAKLLHLDERMGSIRAGKDADLVLWNAHPLSIYARPEKTIIDGAIYFDLPAEDAKRAALDQERARLIQASLAAKATGAATQKPAGMRQRMWHCEDIEGVMAEEEK